MRATANLPEAVESPARGNPSPRSDIAPVLRLVPTVLAAAVALGFFVLDVTAAAGGSRDYDEGVYWQSLRSLSHGYPLFSAVFAPQGPVFFYGLLPVYALLGHSIAAARIGVALYALLAAAAIYIAASSVAGSWAGLVAVGLLTTDPIWAAEAQTLHAEVPSLALALVSVALVTVALGRARGSMTRTIWLAALAGVFLALATATKAFVVVFLVPVVLLILLGEVQRRLRMILAGALGFAATAIAVFLPFLGSWRLVYDDLVVSHLSAGRAMNAGLAANFRLLHLGRELPLELAAVLVTIAAILSGYRAILPALAWVAVTVIALLLYQPLFPHEVALLIPALAFLVAVGAAPLTMLVARRRLPTIVPAIAGLAVIVVAGLALARDLPAWRLAAKSNPQEGQLAAAIDQALPQGAIAIGDNPYTIALADRDTPPQLVDTSFARVLAHTLTADDIERIATQQQVRLFLFETGRLDAVPGLRAWVAARYPQVVSRGGGTIYFLP